MIDYVEWELTEFKSKLPTEEYRFIGRCYEDGTERFFLQKQKKLSLFGWHIATFWQDVQRAMTISALLSHTESYTTYETRRNQYREVKQ